MKVIISVSEIEAIIASYVEELVGLPASIDPKSVSISTYDGATVEISIANQHEREA